MGDVSDLDIDEESHVQGHVPAFRPSFSTPRANPPCGLPAPSPAAFEVLRFPEQQQASSAKSGGPPAGRPLQPLASRPHAAQARSYQLGEARNTPAPATKQPRPAQPDAPDTALQPSGSAPRKPRIPGPAGRLLELQERLGAANITSEDVGLDTSTLDGWGFEPRPAQQFQSSSRSWQAAMASLEVDEFDGGPQFSPRLQRCLVHLPLWSI